MRKRQLASPIARRLPTQSIWVNPAASSLLTRESIALLVAVHARMREPSGMRERHAAVMNDDLPVPGGPCTTETAPSSPTSAARCPGLRRASCFCCCASDGLSGRHGDVVGSAFASKSAVASAGFSFSIEHSACTRCSAVDAEATSTHFCFPGGSIRGGCTSPCRRASASMAIARNLSPRRSGWYPLM